jgi:hypothetical protein
MPAITLLQARQILGTYIEPDGDFTASLNQVVARLMSGGTYRDLTVQYSLPLVDGVITLPDDADSILHAMADGYPTPIRSLWHDFKSIGMNSNVPFGFVDSGFWPTVWFPAEPTSNICIESLVASGYPYSEDSGERIRIEGNATDSIVKVVGVLDDTIPSAPAFTFSDPIAYVTSLSFDGLLGRYALRTTAGDESTTIAVVGPDSGVTRYRKFRLSPCPTEAPVVHVLCKRAFIPLSSENDVLPVSNLSALKHGLLGRISEDNADIERSRFHWGQAVAALEEEAGSTMGAAVPRLNVDPFGTGGRDQIVNLY